MCLEHPLSTYHWHLLIVDLFTCNQETFIDYGTQFWVGPIRLVTFRNPPLPFSHKDRVGFIDSINIGNYMVSFSRFMRWSWSKRTLRHIGLFEFLLLLRSLKFSSSSLFSSWNWIGSVNWSRSAHSALTLVSISRIVRSVWCLWVKVCILMMHVKWSARCIVIITKMLTIMIIIYRKIIVCMMIWMLISTFSLKLSASRGCGTDGPVRLWDCLPVGLRFLCGFLLWEGCF